MRVFAISGYSGTGKTALVEEIVRALVGSGYSVATIKSSIHDMRPEQGTDTWRHMEAGASLSIFICTETESVEFADRVGPDNLEKLSKYDFLIVEGMKSVNIPKFWCIGNTKLDVEDVPENTQAIVSWRTIGSDPNIDIPVFSSEEIEELVDIVKTRALEIG